MPLVVNLDHTETPSASGDFERKQHLRAYLLYSQGRSARRFLDRTLVEKEPPEREPTFAVQIRDAGQPT